MHMITHTRVLPHAPAHTHTYTHARTHAHTHTRARAHTHTHTRTHHLQCVVRAEYLIGKEGQALDILNAGSKCHVVCGCDAVCAITTLDETHQIKAQPSPYSHDNRGTVN